MPVHRSASGRRPCPPHDKDDRTLKNTQGRGTKGPLVLVAAERGGEGVAQVVPTHGRETIAEALDGKLAPDIVVMTDGLPADKPLGAKHAHLSVNHADRDYARTAPPTGQRVHVNRAEQDQRQAPRSLSWRDGVSLEPKNGSGPGAHGADGATGGGASPPLCLPNSEAGLMARRCRRKCQPQVMRCDLLPSNLTAGKEARVRELLRAWRKGAVLLGQEQWRLFFETGRFDKNHDLDKITFASVIGAANRAQMCRWQVVGQLQGWLSNRANEFHDTVNRSSLSPDIKHMLHVINRLGAWFPRSDVAMPETGKIIPPEVRKLARSIMRHVMSRHHRRTCRASPCGSTTGPLASPRRPRPCRAARSAGGATCPAWRRGGRSPSRC